MLLNQMQSSTLTVLNIIHRCLKSFTKVFVLPILLESFYSTVSVFDLCVALMGLGEVCEVVTDAKYAYGQAGK